MFSLIKLIKSTSVVGISTIISRIFGYIREILLAAWMGTSCATDALIFATRIPTLLRKISTEGSLNGALIPIMDDLEKHNKHELTKILINRIIITFSIFFIFFFLFETFFPKSSLFLLAPGILENPESLKWFTKYIPFTSLAILFFFLSGIFSAVLNYNQKFFMPAIAPAFWNIALILFVWLASKYNLDYSTFGPAFLFATIIQALVCFIPYLKLKMGFQRKQTEESKIVLKSFFKKFFPVMFSASVTQINSIIVIILTSFLPEGNTTLIHRTERLLQVPIGLILALSTPLLPMLTRTESIKDSKKIIKSSLIICAGVFVPISTIFFFFPTPIVKLIFNYGKSTPSDIATIANLLKIYAFGLPAFLLIRIVPIFFFAKKEVSATTKGAIIHTSSSILLSILFMKNYHAIGLVWAGVTSSWIHVLWLFYNLIRKKYI